MVRTIVRNVSSAILCLSAAACMSGLRNDGVPETCSGEEQTTSATLRTVWIEEPISGCLITSFTDTANSLAEVKECAAESLGVSEDLMKVGFPMKRCIIARFGENNKWCVPFLPITLDAESALSCVAVECGNCTLQDRTEDAIDEDTGGVSDQMCSNLCP
jgi:hypothetical protein